MSYQEDGNVIHIEFPGPLTRDVKIEGCTEVVFHDTLAALVRMTVYVNGDLIVVRHALIQADV